MSDTTRDQFKQVFSGLECASGAFSKQAEETMSEVRKAGGLSEQTKATVPEESVAWISGLQLARKCKDASRFSHFAPGWILEKPCEGLHFSQRSTLNFWHATNHSIVFEPIIYVRMMHGLRKVITLDKKTTQANQGFQFLASFHALGYTFQLHVTAQSN